VTAGGAAAEGGAGSLFLEGLWSTQTDMHALVVVPAMRIKG